MNNVFIFLAIISGLTCKNLKDTGINESGYSEQELNTIAISLFIDETFNCKETPCEICLDNELYHDKDIILSVDNIWADVSNPIVSYPEGLVYQTGTEYSVSGYKAVKFKSNCSVKFSPIFYTKDKNRLSGIVSYYSGVFVYFIEQVEGEYVFINSAPIRS